MDAITKENNQFKLKFNVTKKPENYLGASTIEYNTAIKSFTTKAGKFKLYEGITRYYSVYLDNNGDVTGAGKDSERGKLLTWEDVYLNDQEKDWVKAENLYCYAIGNQILILKPNGESVYDFVTGKIVKDVAVGTNGRRFIILQSVQENGRNNKLYYSVIDDGGRVIKSYQLMKDFNDELNVRIDQAVNNGSEFLFIIKTNNARYLGKYDFNADKYELTEINNFVSLKEIIPGPGGYYLFGYDDNYFYYSRIK